MATDELDAMLVRNLAQARLAYDRLEHAIQPAAQREVEGTFEAGAEALGWSGDFDWNDAGIWIAPGEWSVGGESEGDGPERDHVARVEFMEDGAGGEDQGADHFWIVTACGAGRGRYGLGLVWRKSLGVTKPRWRAIVNANRAAVDRLVELGFVYLDDGSFFRSVEFEAEALAVGIETTDYAGFTRHLAQAISELSEAAAEFGKLLADARASPATR